MEHNIGKEEFKRLFYKYGVSDPSSGWTEDYWNKFFENETDKRYFFTEPTEPNATRMFISSDAEMHRLFLLTEEAEESLFGS